MQYDPRQKRLYSIHSRMKSRCYNTNDTSYKWYGGKGIKICDQWLGKCGFINFYTWAIDHGYTDDLTIDRINPDSDYTPENCRWISKIQNSINASHIRSTKKINKLQLVKRNLPDHIQENLFFLIEEITDRRIKQGITQTEVSVKTGLSREVISDFEYKLKTPQLSTLLKIADALDCKISIDVDEIERQIRFDTTLIHQDVPLPSWLVSAAKEANLNLSELLQKAIETELQKSAP